MAKKKPAKGAASKAPKKIKRNIVRRTNKNGKTYFYNKRKGAIASKSSFKKESKLIKKRKEAQKIVPVKAKKKRPRKGTAQYKKWRQKYSHLRKCSKVRAIAYRHYPEIFQTYASTAPFCKFFLQKKQRATLSNIDAAVKEFTQTIAKPDIPEYFLTNWFWFELDFRTDELRTFVIDNRIPNLWVRSQISSMPTFLINEYTYDSTFKAYVDWKNAQQDSDRAQGRDYTELWVSLNFNSKKARWEIFIEEEDNAGEESYAPKKPYDDLIKDETKEQGPIVAKGGEKEAPKQKRKKQSTKSKPAEKPRTIKPKDIKDQISNLEQKREALNRSGKSLVEEMLRYKNAGEQDLYAETKDRIKEMRKEIDAVNRQIIHLKTMEKGGKI